MISCVVNLGWQIGVKLLREICFFPKHAYFKGKRIACRFVNVFGVCLDCVGRSLARLSASRRAWWNLWGLLERIADLVRVGGPADEDQQTQRASEPEAPPAPTPVEFVDRSVTIGEERSTLSSAQQHKKPSPLLLVDAFFDVVLGSNKVGRGGQPLPYGWNCSKGW